MTADFAWKRLGVQSPAAFEEALESLRPRAMATAVRIMGDRTQAEDVVQDAFVKATVAAGQLKDGQSLSSWVRKIVVRCAMDALESRRRNVGSDLNLNRTPRDQTLSVQCALDGLKPEHQAVLALAFGEGLSHQEIADLLDIPQGTVASRIYSAKAAFRKAWEENDD